MLVYPGPPIDLYQIDNTSDSYMNEMNEKLAQWATNPKGADLSKFYSGIKVVKGPPLRVVTRHDGFMTQEDYSQLVDHIESMFSKLNYPSVRDAEIKQLKDQIDNRFPLSLHFAISLYAVPGMSTYHNMIKMLMCYTSVVNFQADPKAEDLSRVYKEIDQDLLLKQHPEEFKKYFLKIKPLFE